MRAKRQLAVIKLGGSFAFSRHLHGWLDAIAASGAGHVVVVPGGGPFADAVRAAQPKMGFDDRAAHHMALLAMEQYGVALANLNSAFVRADSASAIRNVLSRGKVAVWSPTRAVLTAKDIPWSWDVTADSLAAWLAKRIRAKRLLLVKQVTPPAAGTCSRDLVARGIIDPAFVRFLPARGIEAAIAGPAEHKSVGAALDCDIAIGRPISLR